MVAGPLRGKVLVRCAELERTRDDRRAALGKLEQERAGVEDEQAEDVVDELCELGLMAYVRDYLPEPFRV